MEDILSKFLKEDKIIVVGHRGGFKPDNTMNSFKQAKAHKLRAVELDVWVTKDEQIAVIHGGLNGEMPGEKTQYIYDLTLQEARDEFAQTDLYKKNMEEFKNDDLQIPTLQDVFDLFEGQLIVNVEIKAPKAVELKPNYDTARLIKLLDQMIQEQGLQNLCFVSSFDHGLLRQYIDFQKDQAQEKKVRFIFLGTRTSADGVTQKVPNKEVTDTWESGCNIQPQFITKELVQRFHSQNQVVGVWFDVRVSKETPEMWQSLNEKGVDLLCTDFPVQAREAVNQKMIKLNKFPITFITGNKKKLEEFLSIMKGTVLEEKFDICNLGMDLDELQGKPEFIAYSKAKEASKHSSSAVMVDDVSLCFNALKGLPGPYVKDFLTNIGKEGLVKLIANFEDKTAYAQCTIAFCHKKGQEPILFVGKCHGRIVEPRGDESSFGWDPIFLPDGYDQTYAEMPLNIKNTVSHRAMALEKFKTFLLDNAERLIHY